MRRRSRKKNRLINRRERERERKKNISTVIHFGRQHTYQMILANGDLFSHLIRINKANENPPTFHEENFVQICFFFVFGKFIDVASDRSMSSRILDLHLFVRKSVFNLSSNGKYSFFLLLKFIDFDAESFQSTLATS